MIRLNNRIFAAMLLLSLYMVIVHFALVFCFSTLYRSWFDVCDVNGNGVFFSVVVFGYVYLPVVTAFVFIPALMHVVYFASLHDRPLARSVLITAAVVGLEQVLVLGALWPFWEWAPVLSFPGCYLAFIFGIKITMRVTNERTTNCVPN